MINLDFCKAEMQADADEEEPKFDSPHSSRWIVAVDDEGYVTVLSRPFTHDAFFECAEKVKEYFGNIL